MMFQILHVLILQRMKRHQTKLLFGSMIVFIKCKSIMMDMLLSNLTNSRIKRGWERRESKPIVLYIAYIIFMIALMYFCKAVINDDPGKTAVGCVILVIFSELERDIEEYYNGISGLKRVPLISIMWAGHILGLGLFFSSTIMIMVR